jgi:hypothetical protein
LYKDNDEHQQQFFKDLVFYTCKGYKPLSNHENIWLQRLVLHQCPRVVFPSQSSFVGEMLLAMVKKTMDQHVLPNLASTIIMSASFDLWMSCNNVDTFILVINVLNDTCAPMHVIVGLFEVNEIIE